MALRFYSAAVFFFIPIMWLKSQRNFDDSGYFMDGNLLIKL
jgi:hypothetical protein